MPIELEARDALDLDVIALPGKVDCPHLPGPVNRICSSCDALIVAHRMATCTNGHSLMVLPSTTGPVVLWCSECDGFSRCAA